MKSSCVSNINEKTDDSTHSNGETSCIINANEIKNILGLIETDYDKTTSCSHNISLEHSGVSPCCIGVSHTPKMLKMTGRFPMIDIDITEDESNQEVSIVPDKRKPSESFPLNINIDWETADWEAHKNIVEKNLFELNLPLNNNIKYHSRLH